MALAATPENLLRMGAAHVMNSNKKYPPPIDQQAEYTIAWTEEALRRMEKIPVFARGVAKTAIHRYAIEKGHTIISKDRKSTRLNSSHGYISYAVFCLKKKKK